MGHLSWCDTVALRAGIYLHLLDELSRIRPKNDFEGNLPGYNPRRLAGRHIVDWELLYGKGP